jgi:Zn-dependent metalloprotease
MRALYYLLAIVFLASTFSPQVGAQNQTSQLQSIETGSEIQSEDYLKSQYHKLGLDRSKDNFIRTGALAGARSWTHERYTQEHAGVKVYGSSIILHRKEGKVEGVSGYYLPNIDLVKPSLDKELAKHKAKIFVEAKNLYSNSMESVQTEVCIIDKTYPKHSGQYGYATRVVVHGKEPSERHEVIVDEKGHVVFEMPLVMHQSVPGKGLTKYYGEVDITCDSIDPTTFILQDFTRGQGVVTLDHNQQGWINNSTYWDLTGTMDEVALDLHYGMEQFYDMMLERFDWSGIDGQGGQLVSVLEDDYFINAFWNGEFATFGRGDCNHGPLTTLEVVAHELMHGITDYTSDLIYSDESGAINESMSDIFGKALEYYADQDNFEWYIGKSFLISDYGRYFRSMVDPHERNHPKYYGGINWVDGAGVHTNSSIGNHWFYRLVEGGNGTTEGGYDFDFEGLGMENALQIVFLTQKAYLFPNATYDDFANLSIQAAEEIFGAGSREVVVTKEAWKVVGLPSGRSGPSLDLEIVLDLSETSTCLDNEALPFSYTITNVGMEDYDPVGRFPRIFIEGQFIGSFQNYLKPGESMTFQNDQDLVVDFFGADWIWITLEEEDEDNSRNNRDFTQLENFRPIPVDLGVFVREDFEGYCGSDVHTLNVSVVNYSCNTYVGGAGQLRFTDPINGDNYEVNVGIPMITPGGNSVLISSIPKGYFSSNQLEVELVMADDNDISNNKTFMPVGQGEAYGLGFIEDFDLPTNTLRQEGFFNQGLIDYQGDRMLAMCNYQTTVFSPTCPTPEETVRNPTGAYSFCADMTGIGNPQLRFDHTQFRNDNNQEYPELEDSKSVLEVSITDAQGQETYVYSGQTEGEVIGHVIDLPDNFIGEIRFSFFSHTGYYDLLADTFLSYDVLLLDDIQLTGNTTSSDDVLVHNMEVYPVPTHDRVQVVLGSSMPQTLSVYDMSGRLIHTAMCGAEAEIEINTSSWRGGVYLVRLTDLNDGLIGQTKLIKH